MKTIRVASARHNTSGKVINDEDLIIFDDVVLIAVHEIIGAKSKIYIMLDLQVLRVGQILNMEKLLDFADTVLSKSNQLVFLIDDEVARLGNLLAHDRGHLRHLAGRLAAPQLMGKYIADLINLC